MAQVRHAKEVRRAAHHCGERRSRVQAAAANILSSHQVKRGYPLKRRVQTARVIATVNSQARIVRRALHPEDRDFELLELSDDNWHRNPAALFPSWGGWCARWLGSKLGTVDSCPRKE
eukprot:6185005-Pleurochrysis_carterae.AAC.1